jgi:hypothetical protein
MDGVITDRAFGRGADAIGKSGRDWKKRTQLEKERRQMAGYKAKVKELEFRLEYYKPMGKDRDMALDDVEMRRQQMALLDDGILRDY